MRERDIEKYLIGVVDSHGGLCFKWTGRKGVPDRILIMPNGAVVFVEGKRKGGVLSPMQNYIHGQMRKRGANVHVVWSTDDVDALMVLIKKGYAQ